MVRATRLAQARNSVYPTPQSRNSSTRGRAAPISRGISNGGRVIRHDHIDRISIMISLERGRGQLRMKLIALAMMSWLLSISAALAHDDEPMVKKSHADHRARRLSG